MARTRLTLRADLRFIPQRYQDQQYYHIECRSSSEYHRIGYAEYVFVSLLDGHTTFSEALAVTARTLGPLAFPQHKAMQLYVWLLESGLQTRPGRHQVN
jgi:putative peptide zinc metalloprotease protein